MRVQRYDLHVSAPPATRRRSDAPAMNDPSPSCAPPRRLVVQADAFQWMASNAADEGTSVITSLPDVSELSPMSLDEWRRWFVSAARTVMEWVPSTGVAIFFQSDVRFGGQWVDKGYLIMRAAEDAGAL